MPVEINDGTATNSASVPTHKVTVHDRQRGVVHEFFVPEVMLNLKLLFLFLFFRFPEKIAEKISLTLRELNLNFRTSTYCTLLRRRTSLFHSLAGTVLFADSFLSNFVF
jgi:hypothetical protein